MANLTIIGIPLSSYVRTARMAAVEKGVDYELDPLPPGSDAVNAIHPFGKVPVMRHGAVTLCETRAITQYIDSVFSGPALQPSDNLQRARMEQWISLINDGCYDAMIRRYVLQYVFPTGDDNQPDRAAIDAALPDIEYQLDMFERALADGPYLLGDQLSLADLFLLPILFYVAAMPEGEALVAVRPNLTRFHDTMAQRDSFGATLPPPGE